MGKVKVIKQNKFTQIDNDIILDNRISWKAKGLMVYFLMRPDDWDFFIREIQVNATDGEKSVNSGLDELEANGYISKVQKRDSKGRLLGGYDWYIYENPNDNPNCLESIKASDNATLNRNSKKPNRQNAEQAKRRLTNTDSITNTESSSSNKALVKYFEENICKLTKNTRFRFETYCKTESEEFVKALIDYQSEIATRSWKGFEIAICNFFEKNIHTVEDLEKHIDSFRDSKATDKYNFVAKEENKKKTKNEIDDEIINNLINEYTADLDLRNKLNDYIEMRKNIRNGRATVQAFKLVLTQLDKFTSIKEEKIEILNNSIMNSWKGIFELKKPQALPTAKKQYAKAETTFKKGCGERTDVNYDDLERKLLGWD